MEKTIEEMKEEMRRMMTTPPGICWKCGADFFTMTPRNTCGKCLGGFGVEPFSPKGLLICLLFSLAIVTLSIWWTK